mgnify:CR=1 FL=1
MGNDRTGSSEDFHIVIEVKRTADGTDPAKSGD